MTSAAMAGAFGAIIAVACAAALALALPTPDLVAQPMNRMEENSLLNCRDEDVAILYGGYRKCIENLHENGEMEVRNSV